MRTYKEDSPINTINNIRKILYSIDMLPIEHSWYNPQTEIFSVRLENPHDKGGFGTNGKGRSQMFALASAYAEFIERIQNGFIVGPDGMNRIFTKQIFKRFGFHYYPDEIYLSQSDFFSLPQDYLNDIIGNSPPEEVSRISELYFQRIHEIGQTGVIAVPFFDCKRNSIVYLPYNLTFILSGSNGMAAGNTAEESIFQALCELIERYSARTIFFDKLTPPTIPDAVLSKYTREFEIIQNLRQLGYEVQIKDFSCGIKLPALGVILIDRKSNKYRLNIGAESSFQYALSRGLTEIFQGIKDDSTMKQFMLDIPTQYPEYFLDDSPNSQKEKEKEIRSFIINGLGVFPPSLFEEEESYPFSKSAFVCHGSYRIEIQHLIRLFLSLGYNVYIRDVSYLGFPSCYVFIPGVSVWGRKSNQDAPTIQTIEKSIENDKIEDIFFPSTSFLADSARIQKLLDQLAPNREIRYNGIPLCRVLKISVNSSNWSNIPTNFFITLLCIANKEYKNARKFLNAFILETHQENNDYYITVSQLLKDLECGLGNEELRQKYKADILDDFSTLKQLFAHVLFPTCPDCCNCPFDHNCLTKINFNNAMIIAERMREKGLIDQNKIKDIIYGPRNYSLEF